MRPFQSTLHTPGECDATHLHIHRPTRSQSPPSTQLSKRGPGACNCLGSALARMDVEQPSNPALQRLRVVLLCYLLPFFYGAATRVPLVRPPG